jgi:hypothetical protein
MTVQGTTCDLCKQPLSGKRARLDVLVPSSTGVRTQSFFLCAAHAFPLLKALDDARDEPLDRLMALGSWAPRDAAIFYCSFCRHERIGDAGVKLAFPVDASALPEDAIPPLLEYSMCSTCLVPVEADIVARCEAVKYTLQVIQRESRPLPNRLDVEEYLLKGDKALWQPTPRPAPKPASKPAKRPKKNAKPRRAKSRASSRTARGASRSART